MEILTTIQNDLTCFADPLTPVAVDVSGALWVQDGIDRAIKFSRKPHASGFPIVEFDGEQSSYEEFLASPKMGGLKRLAETIERVTHSVSPYIEARCELSDDGDGTGGVAPRTVTKTSVLEALRELSTGGLSVGRTRVVLLEGGAGAGKTVALRELAIQQAREFASGRRAELYFYVNAQGRALSRLEDAIAKELDDLRAPFPYDAVVPLTRHGLLVPIIDGFDELLGAGGYDEAFSSLAALIASLNRSGAIIASARSTFFNYRRFLENATKFAAGGTLNYEVRSARVLEWGKNERQQFVRGMATDIGVEADQLDQRVSAAVGELASEDVALLEKPFYLSRFVELVGRGHIFRSSDNFLDALVGAFLQREQEKLMSTQGVPLLTTDEHRVLLGELAEEMWFQESRRVDEDTLRALVELVADRLGLPSVTATVLVERAASNPFLRSQRSGRLWYEFEHEVLYGYFLATRLHECIQGEAHDLGRFLRRAVADESLIGETARRVCEGQAGAELAIRKISSSVRPGLIDAVGRENGGALAAAIIARAGYELVGVECRNLVFRRSDFGDCDLQAPRFERCEFDEVRLEKARFVSPGFIACNLLMPHVDLRGTRLEGADASLVDQVSGIDVTGQRRDGLPYGRVFKPDQILVVLEAIGVAVSRTEGGEEYSPEVADRIEKLDRFLMKMQRRFRISEQELRDYPFTASGSWEQVWRLLRECGLVSAEVITKSGPKEELWRLTVLPDLIRQGESRSERVSHNVRELWTRLLTPDG